MDNLTHSLTGLMLSRAGLNRFYPRATLVLIVAANIPDIDIVAITRGPLYYFEQHRGLTHSLAALPVMALLSALLACAFGRSMQGWLAAWGIAIIGVASHLLLDWTNIYGIRLLFPFSSQWFHLDLINLFDLLVWAVLLFAWLAPMMGKLVSAEIGAKSGAGHGLAIFALSFFLIYDFGRFLSHQRAIEILNSRLYRDGPPLRVAAFPSAGISPLEWQGWIERPEFVMHFLLNVRQEFDPQAGSIIYKPPASPAIEAARLAHPVQVFLSFAQYPLWSVSAADSPEGAHDVSVTDWRFPFGATALVDSSNRVISSSFHYGTNTTAKEQLSWRLRRDSQPAAKQPSATRFPLWRLRNRCRGIRLLEVVGDQGFFVVSDSCRVLPEVAGTKDSARQLIKLLVFNSSQKARADLCALDNILKRDARLLSKPR